MLKGTGISQHIIKNRNVSNVEYSYCLLQLICQLGTYPLLENGSSYLNLKTYKDMQTVLVTIKQSINQSIKKLIKVFLYKNSTKK